MPSSHRFCFTSFLAEAPVLADGVRYLCYGKEVAPTTGKEHWQGYVELEHAMTGSAAMKRIGCAKCHWESARGDLKSNRAYCSKDGKYTELGEPATQGERLDIKGLVDRIMAGKLKPDDVVVDHPEMYHQYGRTLEKAYQVYQKRRPGRVEPAEVIVFHGEGGTGKSSAARAMFPNAYCKSAGSGKWWDGYDGEEEVIIGEMDESLGINVYKQMFDEPKTWVEIKGCVVRMMAKKFIICSNTHPDSWWIGESSTDKAAFWRRVKEKRLFVAERASREIIELSK